MAADRQTTTAVLQRWFRPDLFVAAVEEVAAGGEGDLDDVSGSNLYETSPGLEQPSHEVSDLD